MKSGVLGASTHQIALFEYLINAKYEGTLKEIKAYTIAVDVFGRAHSFDSSTDSIVRVEMFRLRANLRAFNQHSMTFQLDLPKASYNILIEAIAHNTEKERKVTPLHLDGGRKKFSHSLLVMTLIGCVGLGAFFMGRSIQPFSDTSNCSNILPNVEISNTSQSSDLDTYIDQILHGAASQFSHIKVVSNIKDCHNSGTSGYKLLYTVYKNATSYRTALSIQAEGEGKLLGAQNISGNLKTETLTSKSVNDELYYKLVSTTNNWLMPNGVIHKNAVTRPWRNKNKFKDYNCIAIMYDSFVSDSTQDYKSSLNCLETSYKNGTPLLDNLGGLAASYIEQLQGVRPKTVDDSELEAKKILNKIGPRWNQHVETTIAKIFYEAERNDFNSQRMRDILLTSERANSSNPIILMEVAKQAGLRLGDWKHAKHISNEVKLIQSERDNSVYLIDAAYALLFEPSTEAVNTCNKAYSENSMISNLLINACAIRGQNIIWTKRSDANLQRLGLKTLQEKITFIETGSFDDDFKAYIIDIWKKSI